MKNEEHEDFGRARLEALVKKNQKYNTSVQICQMILFKLVVKSK